MNRRADQIRGELSFAGLEGTKMVRYLLHHYQVGIASISQGRVLPTKARPRFMTNDPTSLTMYIHMHIGLFIYYTFFLPPFFFYYLFNLFSELFFF